MHSIALHYGRRICVIVLSIPQLEFCTRTALSLRPILIQLIGFSAAAPPATTTTAAALPSLTITSSSPRNHENYQKEEDDDELQTICKSISHQS
jgi:hypothetical protein